MPVHVHTACLRGIEASCIRVEVDLLAALPTFQLVGLPHSSIRESKERIRSAIKAQGFDYPRRRITVNLAPADRPKQGTGFDLPIALGLLGATVSMTRGEAPWTDPPFALGELSLDGTVRGVRGALSVAEASRAAGATRLIVAVDNAAEANLVPGLEVHPVRTLREAWEATGDLYTARPCPAPSAEVDPCDAARHDLREVCDQPVGRRVLEIAAAGGHGLLLEGPPGAGKSMLARRLAGLLPNLKDQDALEVTRIRSASGLLPPGMGLVRRPPLRSPHHSASVAAMVGGGRPIHPGEITLAHRGVLFLDEAPEFQRNALEALREPLEEGCLTIARAQERADLPADFILVATRNPCPCGFAGSGSGLCSCLPGQHERYLRKLSGPLLDRIDLVAWIDPVPPARLLEGRKGESSAEVRLRVGQARDRQDRRWSPERGGCLNSKAPLPALLSTFDSGGRRTLEALVSDSKLSARRVLHLARVSRTISDLGGHDEVGEGSVQEADLLCPASHRESKEIFSRLEPLPQPIRS